MLFGRAGRNDHRVMMLQERLDFEGRHLAKKDRGGLHARSIRSGARVVLRHEGNEAVEEHEEERMRRPVLILIAARRTGRRDRRARRGAGDAPASRTAAGAPQTATPPPAGGGGRGQGRAGGDSFPAQQRPPGDPAVIARGKMIFDVACASCHGGDLRGGQLNGPNLLRSQLVLNDQEGELILPIVQGSRADKGMPALPIPPDDVKAIAVYIHSVTASSRGQGSPPRGMGPPPDVLVGDAAAGATYFGTACSKCHSLTGDLQAIGARFPDAKSLQNFWVSGGRVGGRGGRAGGGARGGGAAPAPRVVTATISLPGNEKLAGRVLRYDDFLITLALADGSVRSVRRDGDSPKIELVDPFEVAPRAAADDHQQSHARSDGVSLDGQMKIKKLLLIVTPWLMLPAVLAGQGRGVAPADLRKPLAESWPTYSGDYTRPALQRAEADQPEHGEAPHPRVDRSASRRDLAAAAAAEAPCKSAAKAPATSLRLRRTSKARR